MSSFLSELSEVCLGAQCLVILMESNIIPLFFPIFEQFQRITKSPALLQLQDAVITAMLSVCFMVCFKHTNVRQLPADGVLGLYESITGALNSTVVDLSYRIFLLRAWACAIKKIARASNLQDYNPTSHRINKVGIAWHT